MTGEGSFGNLRVVYTNADQLLNKMRDLEAHIHEREPDVMIITEVIPKAQVNAIPRVCLRVTGYTEYLNFDCELCGKAQQGRGVAIYVKNHLQAHSLTGFGSYADQLWVKIMLRSNDYLMLGALYRSPSLSLGESVPDVISVMKEAAAVNPPYLIICGDFNIKDIDWTDERSLPGAPPEAGMFIQGVNDCLLFQHILQPTRFRHGQRANILDLVFSNEENMVQDVRHLPGLGNSDHVTIHFSVVCQNPKTGANDPEFYEDWVNADFEEISARLLQYRLDEKIADQNVEEAWTLITNAIKEVTQTVVKIKRRRKKLRPYMNNGSLALRRKKERMWNKYCQTRQTADYRNFARVRNQLRSLTRKLRYDMECKVADSIKSNQKAFWSYVNKSVKVKPAVESLKLEDGSVAFTDKEKSNALSSFFQSVYTKENLDDIPVMRPVQVATRLEDIRVTAAEVERRLKALKPGKAPGIDEMKPLLLKKCAAVLAEPLRILFQRSLDTGELPSVWKKALIKTIFKKGDHHSVGKYRPVSLTSVVSKIMEGIVKSAIMSHLLDQSLLSDFHLGSYLASHVNHNCFVV